MSDYLISVSDTGMPGGVVELTQALPALNNQNWRYRQDAFLAERVCLSYRIGTSGVMAKESACWCYRHGYG